MYSHSFYQKKRSFSVRYIAMIIILAIILTTYSVQLSDLQVVNSGKYLAQADSSSSRTMTVAATRGEIIDRYGRSIVYNREGSNIVFDAAYLPGDKLNTTILRMIKLLSKNNEEWNDTLPMEAESPYALNGKDSEISTLRKTLELAHYATADNCFKAMVSRYELEGMSVADQRLVMGVRYTMELAGYSIANPYVFAEDIGTSTVQTIKESSFDLEGVNIETATFREYADPELAPHIIGYTGLMSAEEWVKVRDSGQYRFSDKIGKAGIEKAAEDYLRGTDGKYLVTQSSNGKVTSKKALQETVAGSTVQLTIDANLQKVAQNALADEIKAMQASGTNATGGAVVVTEIKSGEILASANYPSYNMNDLLKNYSKLSSNKSKPLFDRALNGQYPPGSTFKPATALIGLQMGKITTSETINCTHTYTRFHDYQPSCLGRHGSINVSRALAKSCNFFFYELGYRIGISNLNKYCKQLGLGVSTGVELNESKGILAGKEYRDSIGSTWNQGDTIQAAIGQSDNGFTPLQLSMYTATIANGGTRYKAHFIKSVMNYNLTEIVKNDFTEVLDTTEISKSNFDAVKEGMLQVTEDGTASATFRNYGIKVGGKTGTADSNGKTNAMFIAFAPYDNPEIAISIAIENGGHGSAIAPIAKRIFDAYFYNESGVYSETPYNTLLQ